MTPCRSILFLLATPITAEPGFSEKYERDYNIFNPMNQLRADHPLNPINSHETIWGQAEY